MIREQRHSGDYSQGEQLFFYNRPRRKVFFLYYFAMSESDDGSKFEHYNGVDNAPRGDLSTTKRKLNASRTDRNPRARKLRKKLVPRSLQRAVKMKKQMLHTGILERERIAKLEKDLEEVKNQNALLIDEIKQIRGERERNEEIDIENPSTDASELVGQSTIEFEAIGPSSTQRPKDTSGFEESKFMSSINQLSVSSICVPECKPIAEKEEINRHIYEQWRDLLVDSMQLAGVTDEITKFTIFKVKAGPRLLDIYRNAKADADAPDANLFPFTHALYRLKAYFGSSSDIMLQRRRLALMEQKSDESDLAFVTRVGSTARLCDYGQEKEIEEIVGTIAEHAQRLQ
ncbi:uncharacterized protein LOC131681194 [Topomyia yanbarensis]|uniref:uncharacterized protein LOC131681194 n=1 Tax=Topomyia yanbarensis TaxID=2498891 RepID=UPI00273AFB7D|nr:uncharacterized protein LOC131681194 [Topomyia yanbarensis]